MIEVQKDPVRRTSTARILVVEDDTDLALLLTYNLEAEGYIAERAHCGDDAELRLAESPPDLVILDWMLPGVTGIEICARLRARNETRSLPVIMLTARGDEAERMRGFSAGADDYVVKPFSVAELMAARAPSVTDTPVRPEPATEFLLMGDIVLDRANQRVRRGSREVHLSPIEFRLLELFLERPGRVFSRAQVLDSVWGDVAEIEGRTVDVQGVSARHFPTDASATRSARCAERGIRSTKRSANPDFVRPLPPCGHTATHTISNANHMAGADAFADSVAPAIPQAQVAGAKTLRQIAAALKGRGIGTARAT